MQSSSQTFVRRWRGLVAALVAAAPLLAPAVAQAGTNYTWSGAAAPGSSNWSNGTNWEGSAPSGSVGTLTFPALTSPACTANLPTATCYTSTNDVAGLNVNALSIADGVPYDISGNAITLGAGGLTASPSTSGTLNVFPLLNVPIVLSAAQTWSVLEGQYGRGLQVAGNVSGGTADSLEVAFSEPVPSGGEPITLNLSADVEVGPVTVSGGLGSVILGGLLEGGPHGQLDAMDGNPVAFVQGAGLVVPEGGAVGALTMGEPSRLQLGGVYSPATSATLAVNGGVTLNHLSTLFMYITHAGITAGTDYSQISATGAVNLASATLLLAGGCGLHRGDVDTLITTTGAITGTFAGAPDGSTVQVFQAGCSGGAPATVRINYTAHTVTATVLEGSSPALIPTTTGLQVSNAAPAVGEAVTYTATVTPEALMGAGPSGSVQFLDGGTPIGTCSAQPLTAGLSFSSASCMVSYAAAGVHTITATYTGDATYAGSSSAAQTVTVHASSAGGGSTGGGGTTTPTPPPAPTTGTVTVSSAAITVQSSGKASITLACTGTGTCSGTLTLTAKGAKKGKKKRPKTTIIGTGKFSIPAGKSAHVALTLNAAGRALLRADHGRLNATLTILTSSPAPTRTQHVSVHLAQRSTKAKRR